MEYIIHELSDVLAVHVPSIGWRIFEPQALHRVGARVHALQATWCAARVLVVRRSYALVVPSAPSTAPTKRTIPMCVRVGGVFTLLKPPRLPSTTQS